MTTQRKGTPAINDPADLFQQDTRSVIKDISSTPILQGIHLTGIVLTTGTTRVPHRLGRPFVGWKVTDYNANATVWRDTSDTNRLQDAIPLKASAPVTVSLWVF